MDPPRKVTLYFTRHAQSLSNQLASKMLSNISPDDFIDCGLSPEGLDSIVYWRNKKLDTIKECDYIFSSPLKRCLQTALMTYNKTSLEMPIYVMSLLTEFDKYADCVGRPVLDIKRDLDLVAYNNFKNLDFDTFFMDYNNCNKSEWFSLSFRYDLHGRLSKLRDFFSESQFTGKKIHVFSHGGVIGNLCNKGIINYQTVKMVLNQDTKNFISCEFIA